jgi:hypothetical protein
MLANAAPIGQVADIPALTGKDRLLAPIRSEAHRITRRHHLREDLPRATML